MQKKRRDKFRTQPCSWSRHVCRWIVVASVCLMLAGCGAPVVEEDPRLRALTARPNEIETVRLEEHCSSKRIVVSRYGFPHYQQWNENS